jgi:hypothetical protein
LTKFAGAYETIRIRPEVREKAKPAQPSGPKRSKDAAFPPDFSRIKAELFP